MQPEEEVLVGLLAPEFMRKPHRYEERPDALTKVGGGTATGLGGDVVALIAPTALAFVGLVLKDLFGRSATAAADWTWRRLKELRRQPAPDPGPITMEQIDCVQALAKKYGEKWNLSPEDQNRLAAATIAALIERFGGTPPDDRA